VFENTDSTKRQYALRQRAFVLGCRRPPSACQLRKTKAEIVAEIDRLLEQCTDSEVAAELNEKGWRSSANYPLSAWIIYELRTSHKLVGRTERLRAEGALKRKGNRRTDREQTKLGGPLAATRIAERNPIK
jgi:hypothetical protein